MERPYVERLRIENYRCVRHVEIQLKRLHALIGPNDSGKSTILRAIRDEKARYIAPHGYWDWVATLNLEPCRLLRLDPDELRRPQPLIPRNKTLWFQNERGLGLGSLYDALLSRNRAAFTEIDKAFCTLFPHVQALRLENTDDHNKTVALTLTNGTEVGPQDMSEGMLYWLAFAIIQHLSGTGMLLIEEPENGLHPARIAEVMRVLREVSKTTQVIVATHSPLVINELKPEEVTIVTRTPAEGTICTPLTETKNFAERSKVYALGELWLAYADGDLERELVTPPDTSAKAG